MFKVSSHGPFGQLKHRLWPKKGLELKVGTTLISLCAGGVQHTVEKLSTKAITML
jgi:hypothetical protein